MFRWYVINTYSGHENKVKANLEHRIESMNQKIRLLIRRAYGFRSTPALIAMIRLCLAGYARPLPGRS